MTIDEIKCAIELKLDANQSISYSTQLYYGIGLQTLYFIGDILAASQSEIIGWSIISEVAAWQDAYKHFYNDN